MTLYSKIKTAIIRRIEAPIVNYYQRHHPGPLARSFWELVSPFTLACHPDDRWNLHVFVKEWMKVCDLSSSPSKSPKRIFMYCAYRGQFTHNLVLASLLVWRGHSVVFGYFPKLRSPIKSPREDPPTAAEYLKEALRPVEQLSRGRIKCIDLTKFDDGSPVSDEDFLNKRSHADTVMALRREFLDMTDAHCKLEVEYYKSLGQQGTVASSHFFARYGSDLDICIIPNGSTFLSYHVLKAAQNAGLSANCHDKFSFRGSRMINHENHIRGFEDIDDIWDRRSELGFDTKKYRRLAFERAAYMVDQRRQGARDIWVTKTQHSERTPLESLRKAVGLKDKESFVLVCTNVPFDAGYDRITTIFPSMRAWLISTVQHLLDTCSKTIVLRAHPDEARWATDETVEEILTDAGIDLDRLIILPGRQAINTYDLIEMADCGIVFSSTIGLEMAMAGKPVLVGSEVYYAGKGFTKDPKNQSHYLELLTQIAGSSKAFTPDDDQIQKAHLYYFLLHFAILWPYPYDKPSAIGYVPPAELVSSGGIDPYIPTLDVLAMPREEWLKNMKSFISPNQANHVATALLTANNKN